MDKILFFDGYCSLCNNLVDQMVRWDKKGVLKFASLQGETAKRLLPNSAVAEKDPDTLLYLRGGQVHDRSTAVLFSLRDLGGVWVLTSVFLIVPKPLRDLVYRFVANIRYRVFGRRDSCRIPTPQERERILP
jgi:predicted DCC family thiol-disulfide oxidoreductase YuxK